MERVETLLQKLQQQINEKLPLSKLLITVQMMQHELIYLQGTLPEEINNTVSISMPLQAIKTHILPENNLPPVTEEKTLELLVVDEAEIDAELEELKRNANAMQGMSAHSKPPLYFHPSDDDIPTLIHQQIDSPKKEINEWVRNEIVSVNDNLKENSKAESNYKLSDEPVKDLKKAIGINDRFLYINELFRGDEVMYERSIKTINSFSIWPEAEYWIKRELKTKLGWVDNPIVKQFDQLVKRRFA